MVREMRPTAFICGGRREPAPAICRANGLPARPGHRGAFSLIELLVVVAILALLVAILVPSLAQSRSLAKKTVCLAHLHGIGTAVHLYANNNRGYIPFGPKAPRVMTASEFYPSTGAPTSLVSLRNGQPVALGLMLTRELFESPGVLFCPGSEQPFDAHTELSKVGHGQAQSSYYYRHASVTRLFDPVGADVLSPQQIRLDNLGANRTGKPVRALVIDTQFQVPPEFDAFGIRPRTHHGEKLANVVYADGHAASLSNAGRQYTVTLDSSESLRDAFGQILGVLEKADTAYGR